MGLPKSLYHYTSVEGVRGILESKSVWASILHFMNDSREWLYALDLMRTELVDRISARPDAAWSIFISTLSESLSRIAKLNVCVFSLSAVSNQLSQWRAYCPAEGGYALEFDSESLLNQIHEHNFVIRECCYDVPAQKELIRKIADDVLGKVDDLHSDEAAGDPVENSLMLIAHHFSKIAPILKHPDFSEEKEWRAFAVVASNDPRMSYHINGSIAVPHCALALKSSSAKFPIASVMVGPNVQQELAMAGMSAFALPKGLSVSRSTTPLRSL